MTDLTSEARDLYASLASIPWQVFAFLAALIVVTYFLARWTEGYDPMAEPRDPEAPDICGATDGVLTCTVPPHAGDLHLDRTRGTQYHSATFRVGRAA